MKKIEEKKSEENYKTKIAEILFNSDCPTDVIMWALSNLPDNNKKGKNYITPKFDHNASHLQKALGLSKIKFNKCEKIMCEETIRMQKENLNITNAIENVMFQFENDADLRLWVLAISFISLSKSFQEEFIKKEILKSITKSLKKKGNK